MKKNWRQTKWSDFTSKQKMWFCLLCILLVVVLVVACLSTSEVMDIPDWFTLLIVAIMIVSLCKFLQLTPWALMGHEEDQDDEDDIMDNQDDTDN